MRRMMMMSHVSFYSFVRLQMVLLLLQVVHTFLFVHVHVFLNLIQHVNLFHALDVHNMIVGNQLIESHTTFVLADLDIFF